jgi:CRISPR/Cas system-associated endonuclease/helicase Cas3
VFLGLAVSTLARSQAAPADTQPGLGAQIASELATLNSERPKEDWPGQLDEYQAFLPQFAQEDAEFQHNIKEGKEQEKEFFWRSYISNMRLREDEVQEMRTIILDAWDRQKELQRQFDITYGKIGHPINHNVDSETKSNARRALHIEKLKIDADVIAKLKQAFGKEDFKKLDEYLYQRSHKPSDSLDIVLPASLPAPHRPGDNSNTEKAPETQP